MLSQDANTPSLYDAAMHYAALGYSVIPVYGSMSPVRAKAAATNWVHFQHQRPTDIDLQRWFQLYTMGGIALVTGRISRLLVLDFDQSEIHHQFVAAFPHLCDTQIVTSGQRRLPHYYYQLPMGMEIASRKVVGLDLLAEGRYVIAPPTQIEGNAYEVSQDRPVHLLSSDDVTGLIAFIEHLIRTPQSGHNSVSRGTLSVLPKPTDQGYTDASPQSVSPDRVSRGTLSSKIVSAASSALNTLRHAAHDILAEALPHDAYGRVGSIQLADADEPTYGHIGAIRLVGSCDETVSKTTASVSRGIESPVVPDVLKADLNLHPVSRGTLSPERLIQQYQQIAVQVGRNEALFRMGVRARDFGWSQQQVEDTLTDAHVRQPASTHHVSETPRQRIHEAHRTIASVFKRPARPATSFKDPQIGLPVSVREALLSLKQMPLLRVLDGLILKGIVAGARLTEKFITSLLDGLIGRHSVLKAIKAVLPNGLAAFAPSPGTPTHTSVAAEVTLFPGQKMLFVGVTDSNKNRRGRPEQVYQMPSIPYLCQALGVRYTPSDPITADDLKSTRATRQAIHRELLRRRPGLYSRTLLARRLGVSVRSVQRYHRGAEVRVRPAFRQREIFWETLSIVPRKDDVPAYSTFLQDDAGKRYPLDISIVKWLLKQNKRVFLMYQLPNHYSVSLDTLSTETPSITPRQQAIQRIEAAQKQVNEGLRLAACSHNDLVEKGTVQAAFTANQAQNQACSYHDESPEAYPQGLSHDPAWRYTPTVSSRVMGSPSISPVPADAVLFTPQPMRPMAFVPQSEQMYRVPLSRADVEQAAQRLYEWLRHRCTEKTGYMTLAKARQLLDQFGTGAVKRATHLLEMRRHVSNPAGFLISVLRSNAKLAGILA